MCKINRILIVFELYAPCKCVVMKCALTLDGILIITHIFSVSLPPSAIHFGVNFRVKQRFHAVVIKTVGLEQIYDIKPVGFAGTGVLCSEVKPLSLPFCKVIRPQNEIIFVLKNLNGLPQVS